jgi:succinate dehydrogenase hydrophobic anchor subunit
MSDAVPMLDAALAEQVTGFLYWMQLSMFRLHSQWGLWDTLADVQDSADASMRFFYGVQKCRYARE